MGSLPSNKLDIVIIGAGLSGLSVLYNLREQFPSYKVLALEAGPSVGGTWYWNCYPGARFDSESISYQLSWDKDLLQEWTWKEAFAPQKETLKYIERFSEKNDLARDIRFGTTVASATWQDDTRTWVLMDSEGNRYEATFFISCLGVLSNPTLPNIPGIEHYSGESYHTSRFPKSFKMSDLAGKRVGVVGTGATGIQTTTTIAKESSVKSLSVFQRTATWAAPLRNYDISEEQHTTYKSNWDGVFDHCAGTPTGFVHKPDPRKSAEATDEERRELWEKVYAEPGFGKWLGVFSDTYTNREANRLYSDFIAEKIRARVKDPSIAEKLVPKCHGFGTRRVPLESGYYEVFNQSNVELVDIKESPIQKVVDKSLITADGREYEVDILIFATGFNAITGSFANIDFHSKSNRPLLGSSESEKGKRAIWVDHRPRTTLGILVEDMPNMFMVLGPHQPFGNIPRSIETSTKIVMSLLNHCRDGNFNYLETTEEASDKWTEHVHDCGKDALSNEVDSWMTGVNTNVDGKKVKTVARYGGSAVEYRRRCEEMKSNGWPGLVFA